MISERRVADMEREIRKLRQALAQRPIKPPKGGGSAQVYHLLINDGQTVYSNGGTTYYGVKRSSSLLTTVPSVYDPNGVSGTAGSFVAADGIGRATLYINGVAQSGFVLVVHDNRTGSLISYGLLNGEYVEANAATIALPLVSDATQGVICYQPRFM